MLNNVSGVYFAVFPLLLIGQQGLGHFSAATGPCFPLAGGFCKQYANGKENLLMWDAINNL
jgi:hypothetical protein